MPTRHEFLFFSPIEKLIFYVLAAASVAAVAWQIWHRVKLWRKGRPTAPLRAGAMQWIPTRTELARWIRRFGTYVLSQKGVRASRPRSGAPMHLLIFAGFAALFLATTLLAINSYSPVKFHQGTYYLFYEATFDTLGLFLLAGLAWAIARRLRASHEGFQLIARLAESKQGDWERQFEDNRRHPTSHNATDLAILAILLVLTVNGYALEGARIAADPKPWDQWSWVGMIFAQGLPKLGPDAYKVFWWSHTVLALVFIAILPQWRIRHTLLAIFSTVGAPELPMGKLRTVSMEEVEQTEQVGAKRPADLSRWHLMSVDACMECGRCTEVCPAWGAGKLLNPKQIVQDTKSAMEDGKELAPSLSEEALWQCTTCNACVEACPVLIRHVDIITETRRNLVSEGALAGSAATMLRQTQSTGHAWGAPTSDREKWMDGLAIPLCRDGQPFEYLFWVGCAGATDPGAVKTTRAVAQLMLKAGVSFACLGREETCTGDPARRVGEEFLFQDQAGRLCQTFQRYGVKKVVTPCPHCMNTFRNEYGDFGSTLEVLHHSQLLSGLVSKGALIAAKPPKGQVVLHDPCYLARVNDESDAPRQMLGNLQEDPEHHGRKTLCCGAGGGRMWMDEEPAERPSVRRSKELLAGQAQTVALACPFCRIMLEGEITRQRESAKVMDVAEILLEANRGE